MPSLEEQSEVVAPLLFEHPLVEKSPLIIRTGMDNIEWRYSLNTANYPTYGGEVIQILSVFIDDLVIGGTIKTYHELEEIYSFFAEYMSIASQGGGGHGSYSQIPMKAFYTPREWSFSIQPLSLPGFKYSRETVAPVWQMQAHVVDETSGNYETLKEMIEVSHGKIIKTGAELGTGESEEFKLKGIINAASADPEDNPFSAPETKYGENFTKGNFALTEKSLKEEAGAWSKFVSGYIEGNYDPLLKGDIGSKPAFGLSAEEEGRNGTIEHQLKETEAQLKSSKLYTQEPAE